MAMSADELLKYEINDRLGKVKDYSLRVFAHSSNFDQELFSKGGLTFGVNGIKFGSCDAAWITKSPWIDPFDGKVVEYTPAVALEGTDCLNRKSSGNAQYQRFHHALGSVRGGGVGVYYLRKGNSQVRPELYGMASFASEIEPGNYFVTQDLSEVERLLSTPFYSQDWKRELGRILRSQQLKFENWFDDKFRSDWRAFAKRRSTIIKEDFIVKHAGRMRRNFTDSSQRAGHIAVGEMFLTKYFFGKNKSPVKYLFPRMTRADIDYLDQHKSDDKEWLLLRNEPGVEIISIDDILGLPWQLKSELIGLADTPLKSAPMTKYNGLVGLLAQLLSDDRSGVRIRQ